MRKLLLSLLPLLAASALLAVNTGDSLSSVLAEKGEPTSKLERGNVTTLTYGDAVIRLENGVVVSQKKPGADYAVRADKPAPAPRPRGSSRGSDGTSGEWTTDVRSALGSASGTGRKIFLFFTGSDWCGWCKRLDAEVLSTEEFKEYASGNLVLVKLDFPRKIQQSDFTKKRNGQLAEKYRVGGFPTIVVLDDAGEELGRIGYQAGGPRPFIKKLQKM